MVSGCFTVGIQQELKKVLVQPGVSVNNTTPLTSGTMKVCQSTAMICPGWDNGITPFADIVLSLTSGILQTS